MAKDQLYTENQLLSLVDHIYQVAVDPWQWPSMLERVTTLTRSLQGILSWSDPLNHGGGTISAAFPCAETKQQYDKYFYASNPWITHFPHCLWGPGDVSPDEGVVYNHDFIHSEFYGEFMEPRGWHRSMNSVIDRQGAISIDLTLVKKLGQSGYDTEDIALMKQLAPHLQRCWQIFNRVKALLATRAALEVAIDHLAQALVLLDLHGKAHVTNRSAHEILDAHDGLTLDRQGRLTAASASDHRRLRQLIAATAGTAAGQGASPGGYQTIRRPSGKRPFQVFVAPLRTTHLLPAQHPAYVAVFISDPEHRVEPPERLVQRALGLTLAEARLAARLATGQELKEAADELGITKQTARTALKSIFAKTGARRQGELVARLLCSVAAVGGEVVRV